MTIEKVTSVFSRVLFFSALALLTIASVEGVANFWGYTFLRQASYTAGRFFELAAIFLIPVIVILLREIREELRKPKSS